jgi:hemolysin activation/secretion protein
VIGRQSKLITALIFAVFSTIVQAQGAAGEFRFNVDKFTITGDNPLGDGAMDVLAPYVGDQFGLDGLSAAADALEQALIKEGFSFHRVSLPPQSLDTGVVELQVIRFSIGNVNIEGNEHFDRDNLLHSLPQLTPGETPNTQALSRSLKMANNHASKKVALKFKESEQEGNAIDADLTVKDQSPQMIFVSADNTGTKQTEEIRTTLGYQYGNLFNKDHSLTATLTVSPEDVDATRQVGLSYLIPMYTHGATLSFLVSDSEINSGNVANNDAITGRGSAYSVTYARPFLTEGNFEHQWSASLQHKNFEGEQVSNQGNTPFADALSAPLNLGYSFNWRQSRGALSGGLNFAINTQTSASNDADYAAAANKPEAKSDWQAIRYHLAYDRLIGESWMLHLGLSGQDSSDLLISGEKFGVGGTTTLRGFEERSITGDSGYQSSIELWFPPVASVRFLAFVDMAKIEDNFSVNNPPVHKYSYDLQSAGFGMRWSWKQQLSVSLDYGKITKGITATDRFNAGTSSPVNLKDDDKAHFSLVYRF